MKTCIITGKTIFKKEATAKKLAGKFSKTSIDPLRAYKCEFCKGWHFTHKKN
jgi:hypothetical protein